MPDSIDQPKLDRMFRLVQWLRGWECCYHCSLTISLAIVEKEAGGHFNIDKTRPCTRSGLCLETARYHWKTMPRRGA
jgi:hypothetical protein